MNTAWRRHFPLLRTLLLLIAALAAIGCSLRLIRDPDGLVRIRSDSWAWAPASGLYDAAPPLDGWRSDTPVPDLAEDDGAAPYYWLRVKLPAGSWADPYLLVNNVSSLRVRAAGEWTYAFDLKARHDRIAPGFHWNLARLPTPLPREAYLLTTTPPYPLIPRVVIGDRSVHLAAMLRRDTDNLLVGALLAFCAAISLGLFSSRRDKLYLHFFLLCLIGSYNAFVRNDTLQILWEYRWLSYFQNVSLIFAVYAFMGIMDTLFPEAQGRMRPLLRRLALADGILTLAASLLSVRAYNALILFPFYPLFFLVVGSLFRTAWIAYRTRKDTESVWMLAGFSAMIGVALVHVLRFMVIPGLWPALQPSLSALRKLPPDLIFWGLLLFVLCIVRVIAYRFGAMNRQLTDWNRALEQLVEDRSVQLKTRSEELEAANAKLSVSMREHAEAMAETMVLEERRRITGTIHDTIGHVLTATIVQLEAARRLIDRDAELSREKLAASKRTVAKGLDELRLSARLLQEGALPFDLAEAMRALIRDTRALTGIAIESDIGELPDGLSAPQKKVLYQALQEGLTNGIRHGESTRFGFRLGAEDGFVRFRLENDGKTYSPSKYGFGLRAMAERVAQLGGTMKVEPGNPGCVLELCLPA